jgi:glycerate kinase
VLRLSPEEWAAAGFAAAHALTEVEPDPARCRTEADRLLGELTAVVLPDLLA